MAKKKKNSKTVETLRHDEASRKNIPTAEYQSVMREEEVSPIRIAYERRNRDLDPQLVWRGKDEQDWSDLVVQAPPLYIQEKIHPKVLIDDLLRHTEVDKKFKNLRDMIRIVENCESERFVVFKNQRGRRIVLDRKMVQKEQDKILLPYRIRSDRSENLR